jgi:hypothetical protein
MEPFFAVSMERLADTIETATNTESRARVSGSGATIKGTVTTAQNPSTTMVMGCCGWTGMVAGSGTINGKS